MKVVAVEHWEFVPYMMSFSPVTYDCSDSCLSNEEELKMKLSTFNICFFSSSHFFRCLCFEDEKVTLGEFLRSIPVFEVEKCLTRWEALLDIAMIYFPFQLLENIRKM